MSKTNDRSIVVAYNYGHGSAWNHEHADRHLAHKYGWLTTDREIYGAETPDETGYAFVIVPKQRGE